MRPGTFLLFCCGCRCPPRRSCGPTSLFGSNISSPTGISLGSQATSLPSIRSTRDSASRMRSAPPFGSPRGGVLLLRLASLFCPRLQRLDLCSGDALSRASGFDAGGALGGDRCGAQASGPAVLIRIDACEFDCVCVSVHGRASKPERVWVFMEHSYIAQC